MKKDYVVIRSDEGPETNEIDFVERFWTGRWDEQRQVPQEDSVAQREEYKIIYPFLRHLPSRSRILDAGCGMGEWTVFLRNQGFDAVGLDVSERTISRLRNLLPGHQFVHGDLRKTGFPEESFDACISWGVFEHFENGLGDCVNEVCRLLKSGGWLFVSVPYQNWRHILRDSLPLHWCDHTYDKKHSYVQPQRFYQWRLTRSELQRELELRRFRVVEIRPIHKIAGVGRWLEWDFRVFKSGSLAFKVTQHLFSYLMPASFVSHMILAVAQKKM
jgi:SAM-dependent methyltransferase